ncbi:M23 family metallopeptidase [Tropicimonas sediminicola]|uniref:Peptidase family M23 n=1 Tax=Tropicimonas sediminicola TaxID=1031541 RepID=A0A239CEZ3_9RHOB|nr:M23 family metallopeptidase [Tropicimonas sediminicola]SNS18680.1 Peptidase family M23 [Tropicimonas sediminicola]
MTAQTRTGRLRAPFLRAALACAATALPASAEPPALGLPIDCTFGETCYIQQYVDRDPGPGQRDVGCNGLANDGHKGTDFGIPTLADMAAGVPVIAAAPGVVRGVRDGMPDIDTTDPAAPNVSGRECGNGVAIDHGDGWETQYCHLRNGSLAVKQGQQVARGEVLGLVGMSGEATFPHVHFSVREGNAVIDPFNPDMTRDCGAAGDGLWLAAPPYRDGGLLAAGILDRVPSYEEVKAGLPLQALPEGAPAALVVWGYAYAGLEGDVVEIALDAPGDAPPRSHSEALPRWQPFFYRAWGIRAPEGGFAPGAYRGEVVHRRGETVLDRREIRFELPAP